MAKGLGVDQLLHEKSTDQELDKGADEKAGEDDDEDEETGNKRLEQDKAMGAEAEGARGRNATKIPVRFKWSQPVTDAFCQALVNIIRAGGRSDSGFKTTVWAKVCACLKKKYGLRACVLTPKHCKDKYDNVSRIRCKF